MQTQMLIFNTLRYYTVSFELLEYQFLKRWRFLDQAVMMIAKCTTVLLVNINWIQMPAFKWWNNKPIADKTCDLILKRNVRAGNIKTQKDFETSQISQQNQMLLKENRKSSFMLQFTSP